MSLNIFEKIIDKFNLIFKFNNNNRNKNIVNKNSPNYGTQINTDKIINKTELPNKSLQDIRKLEISKMDNSRYKVTAIYSDGTKDENFEGYWYGWQLIPGKMPVWTPLGKNNSFVLEKSNFSEISVWVYAQNDDKNVSHNMHGSISIKVFQSK